MSFVTRSPTSAPDRDWEGALAADWEQLPGPIQRLADSGTSAADTEDVRLRKRVLNLSSVLMAALSPIWVITYLVLGISVAAAIPLVYILASAGTMYAHSRTGRYRAFRTGQLTMMLLFPMALMWSLGGFANSSVVGLWSLTAPMGAVFFIGARAAIPWFMAFAALVAGSAALDPALSSSAPDIPKGVIVTFFALNLIAVSATVFILLEYFVRAREADRARSERLLLNVLPAPTAARLKRSPGVIADGYKNATVLFADIVDFTPFAERTEPEALVRVLDRIFTEWDEVAARYGLEKIKTIGDAYMAAAGVPEPRADHIEAAARMALEMGSAAGLRSDDGRGPLQVRIGIDTGPVVAGVIGRSKFIYDLWGDTVNTASRMESSGEPGAIHVTDRVRTALEPRFRFQRRSGTEVKGKGLMATYLLEGLRTHRGPA
jgi:class 3 adenylate cyclase